MWTLCILFYEDSGSYFAPIVVPEVWTPQTTKRPELMQKQRIILIMS